jgi:hypothetical protein
MSVSWMTKYGARRVRVELPTLEDALFAAEGLTGDRHQQIHLAAAVMQVPEEQARAEAERLLKDRAGRPQRPKEVVRGRGSGGGRWWWSVGGHDGARARRTGHRADRAAGPALGFPARRGGDGAGPMARPS